MLMMATYYSTAAPNGQPLARLMSVDELKYNSPT
jgi:hypothetical protein